jgi:hypothetical protein
MDIFDAISIFGETYSDCKKGCKKNKDYLEVACKSFNKSKKKIDKMYDDEIKKINKKSDIFWDLLD